MNVYLVTNLSKPTQHIWTIEPDIGAAALTSGYKHADVQFITEDIKDFMANQKKYEDIFLK